MFQAPEHFVPLTRDKHVAQESQRAGPRSSGGMDVKEPLPPTSRSKPGTAWGPSCRSVGRAKKEETAGPQAVPGAPGYVLCPPSIQPL